jgi:5'-AMP-activated protein kinase catalytic alpha subunit
MSSGQFSERDNQIGDYLLNEEIGSGGFAKVVQGIHIPTGEKVAVKIMDKAQIFSEPLNLNRIQREIAILKIVRHKNIIKLYELMETPNKIYLVMEYCNGGELFDYIVSKQHLTERQACRFFQEIINSVEYLHSLNIVHRDLKPENLLLDKINNKITLKLIDFGISNCYSPEKLLTTPCGTASYAPPEMHRGEEYYGLLSDVWSAGVVLYAMAFGYLPFCEDDEDTNINNIIEGNYEIPEEASPELADLLMHLLDINPLTRYDLEQIKQHPWFNIVKPYKYIPGVIEGYHRIPIDRKIVEECEKYGYDKEKVIESVEKSKYNRNSSVYYIILSKMKREGYHSISDLYSDEFLKYIKDPKNIIYKSDEDLSEFNDIYNDFKEDACDDIKERKNKKKEKKQRESNRKFNKITRHQSHPISENNLSLNNLNMDLSFQLKEDKNKKVNNQKNQKNENTNEKNEKNTNEKNEKNTNEKN